MRSLSSVAIDGSTSVRHESVAYPSSQMSQASLSLSVSGASGLIGSAWLEVSQEVSNTFPVTLFQPTTWSQLPGTTLIVNGDGTYAFPAVGFSAQWIRVVYEPALPASGLIQATLAIFGSSESGGIAANYISQTIINNNGGGGVASFDATPLEPVEVGAFVSKLLSGVVRAAGNDALRMPAVGVVTQVKSDGSVTVQSHGPLTGPFTATSAKILFVGVDGLPTDNIAPLTHVQAIGTWGGPSTLILSVGPQMVVKSAV